MDQQFFQVVFSVLSVVAGLGALVLLAGLLPIGPLKRLRRAMRPWALRLGALVAATAMVGSLYFSEVAHYTPCILCWYQRISMYGLAIILVVAAIRRDLAIRPYAIALCGFGLGISLYHYGQELPVGRGAVENFLGRSWWGGTDACGTGVPCSQVWYNRFGFVTLAFSAFTGFLAIFTLMTLGDSNE